MRLLTHQVAFARPMADRLALWAEGRVVEEKKPEKLLDNPQWERAKSFWARFVEGSFAGRRRAEKEKAPALPAPAATRSGGYFSSTFTGMALGLASSRLGRVKWSTPNL
jgi:ABC-type glutathione transport system ATPase component